MKIRFILTVFLFQIISDKNEISDDTYKYYTSHNVLTLLQVVEENQHFNSQEIELFCDVLIGENINWFDIDWVTCIQNAKSEIIDLLDSNTFDTITQNTTAKRGRLKGKSEFDFIDQLTPIKSDFFINTQLGSNPDVTAIITEVESIMFNVQLSGNIGVIFGNIWKSLENEFVNNMEKCFFHRRILFSELEPYVLTISEYINKILNKKDINKLKLVKQLQFDLYNIPGDVLAIPDITRQSLLAVSNIKVILTQTANTKYNRCKQYIQIINTDNWIEKQCQMMLLVYKGILQTEVCMTLCVF